MRGIVLAGGTGSRLWPITRAVCKQLLPIYDKPLVYYPLSTLMQVGIRDILVITTPADSEQFHRLLGDGSQFGISLSYASQPRPEGLAQAFVISADFIADEPIALVLGDNIFHGVGLGAELAHHATVDGAHVFAYQVARPSDYGVIELGTGGEPISIEEKPTRPRSNFAVPGLYFFSSDVVGVAGELTPSARGELEITDVIDVYLQQRRLQVSVLPRGTAWLDTGTFASLVHASEFVRVVEERQGLKVGCPEEIAWRSGWITDAALASQAETLSRSGYGDYLRGLLDGPLVPAG